MPLSLPSVLQSLLAACGLFFAFSLHLVPLCQPNPPWLLLWLLWGISRHRQPAPLAVVVGACLFLDILLGAPLGWTCALMVPSYVVACLGTERWPAVGGLSTALILSASLYYVSDSLLACVYGFHRSILQTLLFWLITLAVLWLAARFPAPSRGTL
ncbi:MAG: hypothetical protein V4490_07480 [Pseudomonadota bacterium]